MTFTTVTRDDETYETLTITAMVEGEEIGFMSILLDEKSAYIERIDVKDEHIGKGFGTEMLRYAATLSDMVYASPDNEGSKRLFNRVGSEMSGSDYEEYGFSVDQGYGVYFL